MAVKDVIETIIDAVNIPRHLVQALADALTAVDLQLSPIVFQLALVAITGGLLWACRHIRPHSLRVTLLTYFSVLAVVTAYGLVAAVASAATPTLYDLHARFQPTLREFVKDRRTFSHVERDNNCSTNRPFKTSAFCLPEGQTIESKNVRVRFSGCGSKVKGVSIDPDRPNCAMAHGTLRGCGYTKLPFGIKDCRGSARIGFDVVLSTSATKETTLPVQSERVRNAGAGTHQLPYTEAQIPPDAVVNWDYTVSVSRSGAAVPTGPQHGRLGFGRARRGDDRAMHLSLSALSPMSPLGCLLLSFSCS